MLNDRAGIDDGGPGSLTVPPVGVGRPVDDDGGPGSLTVPPVVFGRSVNDSKGTQSLTVPPEGGGINLGALRRWIVPTEDLGLDACGEDVDFSGQMLAVIQKPQVDWWFAVIPNYWFTTRMVGIAKTGGYGTEWYCVLDPTARGLLRNRLMNVMVLLCYLIQNKVWCLWIIKVNATKWWGAIEPLFRQDLEFYADNVFRVEADMSQGFYSLKAELFSELRLRGAMMPPPPTRSANDS